MIQVNHVINWRETAAMLGAGLMFSAFVLSLVYLAGVFGGEDTDDPEGEGDDND